MFVERVKGTMVRKGSLAHGKLRHKAGGGHLSDATYLKHGHRKQCQLAKTLEERADKE